MNILVIGNGFDLAHKLPTKYGDFLNFISVFKLFDNSPAQTEDSDIRTYLNKLFREKKGIYDEIKSLIENNVWIDYFSSVYENRKAEGKEGWIDFENEIATIIKALDSARFTIKKQLDAGEHLAKLEHWQYKILQPIIYPSKEGSMTFSDDFVLKRKEQFINDLNRLTRCLEIYLSDYIVYNDCKTMSIFEKLKIDHVLSFNYTTTYCELYDDFESNITYDYVHGKARIDNDVENCDMVIGIDEYLVGDAKNADNEFIQFKKFYQRIYKGTGCKYIDWLQEREFIREELNGAAPDLNIFIFGHSLDVTDKDILKKLILEEGAKTEIFYRDKKDLGDKIANLVKIIDEDRLIKLTDGTDRIISFKPINN